MAAQRPIVFAFGGYGRFVGPPVEPGRCALARFANRELIARVVTPVAKRRCVLIGSVAPPETQLASLVLVAHTLRRAGAASITALLPYLAYARQDIAAPGDSLGLAWIGQLLRAVGVDDVVAVDVQCAQASDLLGVPLHSLSPARLLADSLPDTWREETTFVAPDEGAIERCDATAAAAGRPGRACISSGGGMPAASLTWLCAERSASVP